MSETGAGHGEEGANDLLERRRWWEPSRRTMAGTRSDGVGDGRRVLEAGSWQMELVISSYRANAIRVPMLWPTSMACSTCRSRRRSRSRLAAPSVEGGFEDRGGGFGRLSFAMAGELGRYVADVGILFG